MLNTELGTLIQQLQAVLGMFQKIDFGYPLGDNYVRPQTSDNSTLSSYATLPDLKWLFQLYRECNGANIPDVRCGYFIKPLERVISYDRTSEPDTLVLDQESRIVPFGSTGGGDLFAIDQSDGRVLLLPPARMANGRYYGSTNIPYDIAPNVSVFISRIIEDVIAVTNNTKHHKYIA
jgi:hypothetical protein